MKKIKLTKASVLVCFLSFTLLFGGEGLWAKSQSATFEMTSDVLCGTGGKAQSATFTMKVSAGAQGSPIGPQSSTSFHGFGGWVYTTAPEFMRGDANGDKVLDVGDVVYMINYLFKGGPAPCPAEAGDANCDGNLDVGDVVYLINYLFKGGPPPCSSKGSGGGILAKVSRLSASSMGHAQISLVLKADQAGENVLSSPKVSPEGLNDVFEITVPGKFDREVAGVQLEIEFNPNEVTMLDPALTPLSRGLQLYVGTKEGMQKIGILDITGENVIPAGEGTLVTLRAKGENLNSIKIRKAILVDKDAMPLALEFSPELKVIEAEHQESLPQAFSLSQNHPNPFNPETSVKYALPQDAYVKLVIYNVLGQRVKTLVDERQPAGYKTMWWNGTDDNGNQVASGIYFYRLVADKFSEVKKMMFLK